MKSLELQPLTQFADTSRIGPYALEPPGPHIIGRSSEANWQIPNQAISRRHAILELFDNSWYIADLGSRHGTFLNGQRISGAHRAPLAVGDMIKLGEWVVRCRDPNEPPVAMTTTVEKESGASRVEAVQQPDLAGIAQLRLNVLLDISRSLNAAATLDEVVDALAAGITQGTNCPRSFVVRQISPEEFEILNEVKNRARVKLSRSLITAASAGQTAQLTGEDENFAHGQSIIDLGIRTAICSPVLVSNQPELFLYLDTRGSEQKLAGDTAAFCQALAQLGGMALERLHRTSLAEHWQRLEQDLMAARRAQELLMPARQGRVARINYAFEADVGRMVAGDLFDVMELSEDRAAFFLGDVAGKGVGAAVLMAATQSQLRTLLHEQGDPVKAVGAVSDYLVRRTESSKFITLVAGVIDCAQRTLEIVDAGHGFCCLHVPGQHPELIQSEGSFPLGVVDQGGYASRTIELAPGARLILFSDGVIEQTNPGGHQFGVERALESLASTETPEQDASVLLEAVRAHAAGPLADDITIASLQLL